MFQCGPSRHVGNCFDVCSDGIVSRHVVLCAQSFSSMYGSIMICVLVTCFSSLPPSLSQLFSSLPVLSPASLHTPDVLVKCGAWRQAPVGFPLLSATPRFRPGESVLALAPVAGSCADPARYLKLVSGAGEPLLVTPHALYAGSSGDKTMVDVACVGGGYSRSAMLTSDFMRLNGPQAFKSPLEVFHGRAGSGVSDVLQFEDGIRCDYTLPLMRARLMEMALTMEDHVARINFEDTVSSLVTGWTEVARVVFIIVLTVLCSCWPRKPSQRSWPVSPRFVV